MDEGRPTGGLGQAGAGGDAAVEIGLGADRVAAIDQGLGDMASQDPVAT